MIDIKALSLIKPKRQYEDKFAFIDKKNQTICLELGATTIVAPFKSTHPSCKISIKDLWSDNLDAAILFNSNIEIPKCDFQEIVISNQDSVVFSSIAALGEDEFYLGLFDKLQNGLSFVFVGFTFLSSYFSPKLSEEKDMFNIKLDYQTIYYLFQMFKHLSGKKTDSLMYFFDKNDNLIYFTNKDKSFYIKFNNNYKEIKYKESFLKGISDFYKFDLEKTSKELIKSELKSTFTPSDKNLFRPLADVFNAQEYDRYHRYYDKQYSVFITKDKNNE